jgi:hypothetical protein
MDHRRSADEARWRRQLIEVNSTALNHVEASYRPDFSNGSLQRQEMSEEWQTAQRTTDAFDLGQAPFQILEENRAMGWTLSMVLLLCSTFCLPWSPVTHGVICSVGEIQPASYMQLKSRRQPVIWLSAPGGHAVADSRCPGTTRGVEMSQSPARHAASSNAASNGTPNSLGIGRCD